MNLWVLLAFCFQSQTFKKWNTVLQGILNLMLRIMYSELFHQYLSYLFLIWVAWSIIVSLSSQKLRLCISYGSWHITVKLGNFLLSCIHLAHIWKINSSCAANSVNFTFLQLSEWCIRQDNLPWLLLFGQYPTASQSSGLWVRFQDFFWT